MIKNSFQRFSNFNLKLLIPNFLASIHCTPIENTSILVWLVPISLTEAGIKYWFAGVDDGTLSVTLNN